MSEYAICGLAIATLAGYLAGYVTALGRTETKLEAEKRAEIVGRTVEDDLPDMDNCPECRMNQVKLRKCHGVFEVICKNCNTSAPFGDSKQEAIDIWNIGRRRKEQ